MAAPYKLQALERARGDLHQVIPPLVNSVGQVEAAKELNISQNTISRWLRDNGYTMQVSYVRKQEQVS